MGGLKWEYMTFVIGRSCQVFPLELEDTNRSYLRPAKVDNAEG